MLTDEQLAAAKALAEAATPGPWQVGFDEAECASTLRACPQIRGGEPQAGVDVIIPFGRAHSDAKFIAASRTLVPELIAEVERLREQALASGLALQWELDYRITADREVKRLSTAAKAARAELRNVLASAVPNERDHPTMSKAWKRAEMFLAGEGDE